MNDKTQNPTLTEQRTSPVRAGKTSRHVDRRSSLHAPDDMSCNLSLHSERRRDERLTDAGSLMQARMFAQFIDNSEAVHHRDIRSARLRLESLYGIDPNILWKWRSRPPNSVLRSELVQLAELARILAPQAVASSLEIHAQATAAVEQLNNPRGDDPE